MLRGELRQKSKLERKNRRRTERSTIKGVEAEKEPLPERIDCRLESREMAECKSRKSQVEIVVRAANSAEPRKVEEVGTSKALYAYKVHNPRTVRKRAQRRPSESNQYPTIELQM
jgi:hypothetical protein